MKALQVRNVPDELHRRLKSRAAANGKSLSEYVLGELERSVQRPTTEELLARVRALGPAGVDESGAEAVRAERTAP